MFVTICLPYADACPAFIQVLSDPRQRRFFKAKDMRDLFTLGDEYANNTETSEIFASVNGEVTAALQSEQPSFPDPAASQGTTSGEHLSTAWKAVCHTALY